MAASIYFRGHKIMAQRDMWSKLGAILIGGSIIGLPFSA